MTSLKMAPWTGHERINACSPICLHQSNISSTRAEGMRLGIISMLTSFKGKAAITSGCTKQV